MLKPSVGVDLIVSSAVDAAKLYAEVFNGEIVGLFDFPDQVGQNEATLFIGGQYVHLLDAHSFPYDPPVLDEEESYFWFQLETLNVEAVVRKATDHGFKLTRPISEMLGQKSAEVQCPFGYRFVLTEEIRKVTFEEKYEFYKNYQGE